MHGRTFFGDFGSVTFRNTKGTRCKYHLGDLKYDLGTGYGTTHCMLGGAIDGGHCDILFAYTNVRIVDKVANDESRKKKARQLSESAHVDNAESTHTYTFGRLLQPGQRFYT